MADARPPTAFRLAERRYRKYKKSRRARSSPPPTDFSDVLDARAAQCSHDAANASNVTAGESAKQRRLLPLAHDDGGSPRVYAVDGVDGMLVVPNAVPPGEQVPLLLHCMREYAAAPHQLNITCSEEEHRVGLWNSYVSALDDHGAEYCDSNTAISKLHWSTLGFHHNWSTNYYDKDQHTEMPRSLLHVVCKLQEVVRRAVQGASTAVDVQGLASISPEAAIVNYYHSCASVEALALHAPVALRTVCVINVELSWYCDIDGADGTPARTLNGHVDHSEFTFLSPIYSISLGNSAVFLIGGVTKDVEPTALFLHSGDLLVMGGKSRVCYHGVPRILDGTTPDTVLEAIVTSDAVSSEQERRALLHYMKSHRLNLNVRQVLPTPDHELYEANASRFRSPRDYPPPCPPSRRASEKERPFIYLQYSSTETNEERRLRFIAELERTSGGPDTQEREEPVALAHKRQRDEEGLVESGKKVKREERRE